MTIFSSTCYVLRTASCFVGVMAALVSSLAMAQVSVRVETYNGPEVEGRLLSGSLDSILIGDTPESAQSIKTSEVFSVRPNDSRKNNTPAFANSAWILLSSGERLRAHPTTITDENVTAQWAYLRVLAPLQIPLDTCRAIGMSFPSDPIRLGIELKRLMNRTDESDLVTLRNGDLINGEMTGLADLKLGMKTSIGNVSTDLSAVQSLIFNPSLVVRAKPAPRLVVAVLIDGSILQMTELKIQGESLIGTTQFGRTVEIAVSMISDLMFLSGNQVSLVEKPRAKTEVVPYLAMHRDPVTNSNILGGPLFVGGTPIGTGIGVATGSSLSWSLQRDYSGFQACVGVDDAAPQTASCEFEVLVDEQSIWRSGIIRGGEPTKKTPLIELSGKSELTLRCNVSGTLPVKCWGNWCRPVLIRQTR